MLRWQNLSEAQLSVGSSSEQKSWKLSASSSWLQTRTAFRNRSLSSTAYSVQGPCRRVISFWPVSHPAKHNWLSYTQSAQGLAAQPSPKCGAGLGLNVSLCLHGRPSLVLMGPESPSQILESITGQGLRTF